MILSSCHQGLLAVLTWYVFTSSLCIYPDSVFCILCICIHMCMYEVCLFISFTNLKFLCRLTIPWPDCYSVLFLVWWIQGFCLDKHQNSGCYYRHNLFDLFWLCYPSKVHQTSYLFSFLRLLRISALTAYYLSFIVKISYRKDGDLPPLPASGFVKKGTSFFISDCSSCWKGDFCNHRKPHCFLLNLWKTKLEKYHPFL